MHARKLHALIFDFDGVIHNTFDFHLARINDVYGVALSEEEYRQMHDGNFYEGTLDKMRDLEWRKYADAVKQEQARLLVRPDIKRHLEQLARNYSLFLVTSGFRVQIEPYLKNNELFDLFTDERYAEDSPSKRDKLYYILGTYGHTTSTSVFVTDTLGDLIEANEVGVPTIAVTFGFHDHARLQEGNPNEVVDSWGELPDAVHSVLASRTSASHADGL